MKLLDSLVLDSNTYAELCRVRGGFIPTSPYYNAKGERIPGNTTVIGTNLGWKTPGLVGWMRKSIMSQLCLECAMTVIDPYKLRDKAADAGTLGHAMIEAAIKKKPQPDISKYDTDVLARACKAYDNYLEWARQTNLDLITMEVPCVSELYQFGTTIDIIALVAGKLSIIEVKTSNDIYPEMLIQVAAQVQAWNETHTSKFEGDNPMKHIEACHILKIGKEEATFGHFWFAPDALLPAFEAFELLRSLHDKKKILEKLA